MQCPKCQSSNVETGDFMSGGHSLFFYLPTDKLFAPRQSGVVATVCLECGHLFDFSVKRLNKLKKS